MMIRNVLIGLGAGLAAALLYAGLLTSNLVAVPLFLISPLPIAIAGLGFGTLSGALAAAMASALIAIALDPVLGVLYLINYAAPVAWVAHLVGLSRPSEATPDAQEWFPLDTVLLRAGLATALSVVAWTALRGYDSATLAAGLLDALTTIMADGGSEVARGQLEPIVGAIVTLMPVLFAFSVLVIVVFNVYVGARIVQRSGLLQRPWTPLWRVRPQRILVLFFGLTLAATFIGGSIGEVGGAFAGAFAAIFALTGYGLVHASLLGRPARGVLLWLLYVLTFLFSPTLVVMCVVGVADSLFDLRSRRLGGADGPK
ncbi:hypothetical protein C3941_07940 [Kaistia algarum]|uniref:DUF2232 domain-containing protein n=1 Tax=Kaistia algarum TaxID=2083279 RepID=UPI000CE88D76|nr:DUF2232 domain-containing protein [Kaistia algarum]MCX5511987.1 DUF2232 domain-containing protein [Kaistia algarum]PPE80116.1 hypothetical protein C3941_07940 [Kaistia algarum]